MKKAAVLTISALIACVLLSGCGQAANEKENEQPGQGNNVEVTEETDAAQDEELYRKGRDSYDAEQYDEAIRIYTLLADKNHDKAMARLGYIYCCGYGAEQNLDKGLPYLQKAYENGDPLAGVMLGNVIAAFGDRIGIDPAAAPDYLKCVEAMSPEDEDYAWGYYSTGLYYYSIIGDMETAAKYFQTAADHGDTDAMTMLAQIYTNPGYSGYDPSKALDRYMKSYEQNNDAVTAWRIGCLYENGLFGEPDYEQAFQWYQTAAENGYGMAYNSIGDMYENGRYVEQDAEKALEYYERTLELGESIGYISLGYMYEQGHGVEQSNDLALEYYNLALEYGDASTQQIARELIDALNAGE